MKKNKSKLSQNRIEKSFSYTIGIGVFSIEYRENDKLLKIYTERIFEPSGFGLDIKDIKTWTEPEKTPILEKERNRIIKNVTKELESRGYYVEIDELNQKTPMPTKARKKVKNK